MAKWLSSDSGQTPITQQLPNWQYIAIAVSWLLVQMIVIWRNGIHTNEEAGVYMHIANEILGGNVQHSVHYWLYSGYIGLLVIVKLITGSFLPMYALHLCASAIALWVVTRTLCQQLKYKNAVFFSAFLWAVCPFIQGWTPYLYTDPLFGSLLTIAACQLFAKKKGYSVWLSIFGLMLPFFRPVGFLFVGVAVFHFTVLGAYKNRWMLYKSTLWLSITAAIAWYALHSGTDFFFPKHNAEANIICGLPSNLLKYLVHPYEKGMSMTHFFTANPNLSIRLFAFRLYSSFWMTRPFYSNLHNYVIILVMLPYYLLALLGVFTIFKQKMLHWWFVLAGIAFFVLPNVLLCADWNNRFMLTVLPFVLLTTSLGADTLWGIFHGFSKRKLPAQTHLS